MKEYDAVLAHGYMFGYTGENTSAWLRNHMQDTAASHLYHTGQAKKIFLSGGHYWGTDNPSNSDLMKEELIGKGVLEEDIVINPVALDTATEIDLFNAEALSQGWSSIASLSNATHTPRIELNYQLKGIDQVDQIKAEDVLFGIEFNGRYPYRKFLRRFSKSPMELMFQLREAPIRWLTRHGHEESLRRLSNNSFVQKIKSLLDS